MTISIWYRYAGGKPEVVDRVNNWTEARYLEGEYRMAFGVLPWQHSHGKDKVWAGRIIDEPKE